MDRPVDSEVETFTKLPEMLTCEVDTLVRVESVDDSDVEMFACVESPVERLVEILA